MVSVFELMCSPNYGETLLFVQKRSNDWTIFFPSSRRFTCSLSSCGSDVLINIFDNFFDNYNDLTRVLELLCSTLLIKMFFLTRLARHIETIVSGFSNLFITRFSLDFNSLIIFVCNTSVFFNSEIIS